MRTNNGNSDKRRATEKVSSKATRFYRRNWYRILFLLLAILSNVITARVCSTNASALNEEPVSSVQEPIRVETLTYTAPVVNKDAAALARVLYGINDYQLPDNAKIAVLEVVLNRVDCPFGEFGDSIIEVCNKPQQWQGYVENGKYLSGDYELALNLLNDKSGARQIPEGCYFLSCSSGQVSVRTEWNGGNSWTVK